MDYKKAGVDIEAGYKSVELMKEHVKKNHERGSTGQYRRIFRCIFHGKDSKTWKNRYSLSGTDGVWYESKTGIYSGQT